MSQNKTFTFYLNGLNIGEYRAVPELVSPVRVRDQGDPVDHVEVVVALPLEVRHLLLGLAGVPVDDSRAKFPREELIDQPDQTLVGMVVVELSPVVLLRPGRSDGRSEGPPVPLLSIETVELGVQRLSDDTDDAALTNHPMVRP